MGVFFANLVFQILSVVVGEESFVVYKENDLGDWDGSVAIIDGRSTIENFEAFFERLVLRGGVFF